MKKTETISFTINSKANLCNKDLELGAKKLDINKSQYIVQMLEMVVNMDDDVTNNVLSYAKGLDVHPYVVLQNILVKYFVESSDRKGKPLPEFTRVMNEEGHNVMLTGEDIRDYLEDQQEQKKEQSKYINSLVKDNMEFLRKENAYLKEKYCSFNPDAPMSEEEIEEANFDDLEARITKQEAERVKK